MQPWNLISSQFSIDDLAVDVNSVEATLVFCEKYLVKNTTAHPGMRERHVRFLLREMLDRGQITESDQRYAIINDFYLKHFGERSPSYVENAVSLNRS